MSISTIKLDGDVASSVRAVIESMISGGVSAGPVSVSIPGEIEISIQRKDDHVLAEWSPKLELDIPGPVDPDILSIRAYRDHAIVDMRLSGIRIDY